MGLNEFYSKLFGFCIFRAKGEKPERLLNLAAKKELGLWDIEYTESGIQAKIIAHRYRKLLPLARKCSVRLQTVSKHGLPFLITPYMHRPGIALGVFIFCGMIWFLSQFIWFIELPKDLSPQTAAMVETRLSEAGLRPGVLRSHISGSIIADELILHIPDISWAGISIIGSNVTVEAKEIKNEVHIIDRSSPRNLVASCDGVIESVLCTNGQAVVTKGDAVAKGELLISGVVEYDDSSVHFVYAEGEVTAKTNFFLTSRVEYEQKQYRRTGKVYTMRRVMFFGLELPLWIGKMPEGNFDREYERITPELSGIRLPFEMISERWFELEPVITDIGKDAALAKARAEVAAQLNKMELIEIISVQEDIAYSDFAATCTIYVTALQSIAQETEILFE